MLTLTNLVATYGYWALFIGTFLEGETILIIAGIAARLGMLNVYWVAGVAFIASLLSDQLFFLIGRYRGKKFLEKRPQWQPRMERAHRLLEKHQILIMLSFRFLYGLRTIIPLSIGTSRITIPKFTFWNVVGAAIWAASFTTGGYWFGGTLEILLHSFKHYERRLLIIILLIALLGWAIGSFRERFKSSE